MRCIFLEQEWLVIRSFLPSRWQWQVKRTGAVRRMRGIKTYEKLLRALMLHISGGLSLAQASVRAKELGIANLSGVALHNRLRAAAPWLAWLCGQLVAERDAQTPAAGALAGRRVLAVDASDIREPGACGSSWRLHYALELSELRCAHAEFTPHTCAENLARFPVREHDVVMADRAYARRNQLAWLLERKADAVVRISPSHFPVEAGAPEPDSDLPFDWLAHLRTLKRCAPAEWTVRFTHAGRQHTVRICAVRKDKASQKRALRAIELEARKKRRQVRPETLEYARYVIVLTTLDASVLDARGVLELYRCRWQVELAFKRLKGLVLCARVPKSDAGTALSWMQGKLLEALLVEKLLSRADVLGSGDGMDGGGVTWELYKEAHDTLLRTLAPTLETSLFFEAWKAYPEKTSKTVVSKKKTNGCAEKTLDKK